MTKRRYLLYKMYLVEERKIIIFKSLFFEIFFKNKIVLILFINNIIVLFLDYLKILI